MTWKKQLGGSVCGVILCYEWTVPVSVLEWECDILFLCDFF